MFKWLGEGSRDITSIDQDELPDLDIYELRAALKDTEDKGYIDND